MFDSRETKCRAQTEKVYDLDAVKNGQNPFGLLEMKVVKEDETSFDNVRYVPWYNTTNQYLLLLSSVSAEPH